MFRLSLAARPAEADPGGTYATTIDVRRRHPFAKNTGPEKNFLFWRIGKLACC